MEISHALLPGREGGSSCIIHLTTRVQVALDDSNANKSTLGLGRAIRSDSQLINQLMMGGTPGKGNEGESISTASRPSWGPLHLPSSPQKS